MFRLSSPFYKIISRILKHGMFRSFQELAVCWKIYALSIPVHSRGASMFARNSTNMLFVVNMANNPVLLQEIAESIILRLQAYSSWNQKYVSFLNFSLTWWRIIFQF